MTSTHEKGSSLWATLQKVIRKDPTKLLAAAVSTAALLVSAGAFVVGINNDSDQANASEHQQLEALAEKLANVQAQQDAASQGRDTAQLEGNISLSERLNTEEAMLLIERLGVQGVTATESMLVGRALAHQGAQKGAVSLFGQAITEAASAQTTESTTLADAYRARATSEYALQQSNKAQQDIRAAYTAVSSSAGYGPHVVANSRVVTILYDLPSELTARNVDCARREISIATKWLPMDFDARSDKSSLQQLERQVSAARDKGTGSSDCPV